MALRSPTPRKRHPAPIELGFDTGRAACGKCPRELNGAYTPLLLTAVLLHGVTKKLSDLLMSHGTCDSNLNTPAQLEPRNKEQTRRQTESLKPHKPLLVFHAKRDSQKT